MLLSNKSAYSNKGIIINLTFPFLFMYHFIRSLSHFIWRLALRRFCTYFPVSGLSLPDGHERNFPCECFYFKKVLNVKSLPKVTVLK